MKKKLIILLAIFIIFTFCSCDNMDIKEDITETIVEKILGDNAKVEITYQSPSPTVSPQATPQSTPDASSGVIKNTDSSNGDSSTWPEEIPSIIPEINLEIINKMKTPNGIILDFGEVEKITAKQYTNRLKNSSYETIHEDIDEKKIDATYRKDETVAKIYWYKDGAFTLMLTWD